MPISHSESLGGKTRAGGYAAVASSHDAVAQRMDEAVRGWVEQMERMRKGKRDIGQRLMACATPAEAVAVSGEWMAHRLDSLMVLQHRLIEMWLDQARIGLVEKITTMEDGDDGDA